MESVGARIVVLGSANQDYFFMVDRLPKLGETLQTNSFFKALGGKGANQAYAVGRGSAKCEFLAQFGNDEAGKKLIAALQEGNVGTDKIILLEKVPTGGAFIFILPDGENSIII